MKGFTLIELLAVIVILAVLLLIAVPIMSNIVEGVKVKVFESGTKLVIKASSQAYLDRNINGNNNRVVHTFDNYVQTTLPAEADNISFSGTGPKEGIIIVYSDGDIEARISDGKFYSQTDYKGDLKKTVPYDPIKHDPLLNNTTDWIFEVTIPSGGATFSFGAVNPNLTVNWGDTVQTNHNYAGANYITHAYAEGTYNVTVTGTSTHISFCNVVNYDATWSCIGTPQYLTDILTPISASLGLTSVKAMFAESTIPGFSSLNFLEYASNNLLDMSYMFSEAANFNQSLKNLNTLTVTDISWIFYNAPKFNKPVGYWNTSNMTNIMGAFSNAITFNQPLSNWDTSNVTNMNSVFSGAEEFNQSLNSWDTSSVTDMRYMFYRTFAFNQPLSNWDTSNVINMYAMFRDAPLFNQPIGNWNTSNVVNMYQMFRDATAFNQPIGDWDTSKVVTMNQVFLNATSFNKPLANWNTSNVTLMYEMFKEASSFNQPIGNWDTSKVENMWNMFQCASTFNQDLSNWNTSAVVIMTGMFNCAASFNQNLTTWCVSNFATKPSDFDTNTPSWALPKPIWGTCP